MTNTEKLINKVHQSECINFMKKMEDNSIDLVVTSPPYNQFGGTLFPSPEKSLKASTNY